MSPPMNWGPGISEFVSEPIIVNVSWYDKIIDLVNENCQIIIHPNPAKDKFSIIIKTRKKENFIIELVDIQGRIVYYNELKDVSSYNDEIDVSEFAKGVYYLRLVLSGVESVKTEKEIRVKKLVIQ